jgi:putative effector of murein hydrolase LrgA (UPF0299 family)
MSKHRDPVTRIWHGSLLLLGSALAIALTLELLASIWGWLLLIGLLVAGAGVLIRWVGSRRDRW